VTNVPQGEPPDDRAATMVLGPASAEAAQRRRVLAAVVGIGICAALGGYFVGRAGGEDLDAARDKGTLQGTHESTGAARRDGYDAGFKSGRKAGYKQTYKKAYKDAYKTATTEAGQ
jgi:flagellar biosynthesis/type III secretory pathway protein FliH